MTKTIEPVTASQFDNRIIKRKANAVVNIRTAWNGACQMMEHTLEDLAPLFANKIEFYSADHETENSVSLTYMVETIPTLLFFKRGELVDKVSGLTNKTVIREKINQLLNS